MRAIALVLPAGTMASLSFSPRYAAPEMLMSFEARQAQVLAAPAVDMWAIGIIAYEVRLSLKLSQSHAAEPTGCNCRECSFTKPLMTSRAYNLARSGL